MIAHPTWADKVCGEEDGRRNHPIFGAIRRGDSVFGPAFGFRFWTFYLGFVSRPEVVQQPGHSDRSRGDDVAKLRHVESLEEPKAEQLGRLFECHVFFDHILETVQRSLQVELPDRSRLECSGHNSDEAAARTDGDDSRWRFML